LGASGCVVDETSRPARGGYHPPSDSGGYQPPASGGGPGSGSGPVGDSGLSVRWDLSYLDGKASDCDAAGTPTVAMHATQRASGARFNAQFPCAAGGGVATALPSGAYDVPL